jgi:hypothetical protein
MDTDRAMDRNSQWDKNRNRARDMERDRGINRDMEHGHLNGY